MNKLCKHCKIELKESDKGLFCSDWCKEMHSIKNKVKSKEQIKEQKELLKYRKYKVRKCICGADLKKGQHKCDDCKSTHKFEYIICEQKCLQCGGEISAKRCNSKIKKLCSQECQKRYYYRKKLAQLL